MSYPHGYDRFKTHKDFIEDVEANDINLIQEAIGRIELTLGLNPTRFVNKQQGGADGDGSGSQDDRDVRRNVVEYKNIADRLDALERGGYGGNGGNSGLPWFHYNASSVTFPGQEVINPPKLIPLQVAIHGADRYHLWNGSGATISRSGMWMFQAEIIVQMKGSRDVDNYGLYQCAIQSDALWIPGTNREEHFSGSAGTVFVQTTRPMIVLAGSKISLRASHNANSTQVIQKATLTGVMLKDTNGDDD